MKKFWTFGQAVLLALLVPVMAIVLVACGDGGSGELLSDVQASGPQLDLSNPTNPGEINLAYTIGKEAAVSLRLEGPNGARYDLRQNQNRPPGAYAARLTGLVETSENGLTQSRLLPNGAYRYFLTAQAGNDKRESSGAFNVVGNAATTAPQVSNLTAYPGVISPNFDAQDDETVLNWRTSQPATVTIQISGPNNFSKVLKTTKNQPAGEDKTNFNGQNLQDEALSDGVYTYTISAVDRFGQVGEAANTLQIKGGGNPKASITDVRIEPTEVVRGGIVTITMKVKNTGKVPIRSQGPDSGFTYSTRDVYSAIGTNGQYDEKAGYWRVGVDFGTNGNEAGVIRYPWRWGFGKEFLQPGEEVEIVGRVKIDKSEEKITLYAGLIQEQRRLWQNQLRVTVVKISY